MKASVANRIGVDGQIISVSSAARERTRLSDPPTNCVARFAKYNWSERSIIVRAGLLLIYQFERTSERVFRLFRSESVFRISKMDLLVCDR